MSEKELNLGNLLSGRAFTVPREYQVHTTALIGIRGSGKTVAATDIAEEMCEAGLPFVAIDPVGVWWGLRTGYQVVVIGGSHADLPLDKDGGSKIADAILEHSVSCIIDMSSESKNTVRKFVTDFCDRLMELNPSGTRHIFLEEAPELVPQRPLGEQKRSLAAVDRLVRLGRNKGYGCTLISQRFATINKDVLTQCENLIALRCIGKHDRDAAAAWIAEVVHDTESEKKAEKFVKSLTVLENGEAWFWSPQWLKEFIQLKFRQRRTFHPGETRTVGKVAEQPPLMDVGDFVDRFKKTFSRPTETKRGVTVEQVRSITIVPDERDAEIDRLRKMNGTLSGKVTKLNGVIRAIKTRLEPQYRELQELFGDLEEVESDNHAGLQDKSVYEAWKAKLGSGPAKLIDVLLERGALTRVQLKTMAGFGKTHFANSLSKLNTNQLIEKEGDTVCLKPL